MLPFLAGGFGGLSGAHAYRAAPRAAPARARRQVAALIGAGPEEIVLTGSGSEANNPALRSATAVQNAPSACRSLGIVQSMGRGGCALDNAAAESFNSTLRVEFAHRQHFAIRAVARIKISTWIAGFYNTSRRRSADDGLAPIPFERQHGGSTQNVKGPAPGRSGMTTSPRFEGIDSSASGFKYADYAVLVEASEAVHRALRVSGNLPPQICASRPTPMHTGMSAAQLSRCTGSETRPACSASAGTAPPASAGLSHSSAAARLTH
ncbi:integrase core domain-containing protein [Streptomyces fuscichromogenes]|uniref:Integrase catalytic domain-containing protein n=1 Tax=Streptomyces fuscichromogenes TaxID=1324013 RepID=A0A918CXG0_9ACTN|nr:integrase core domain-containing protein [Streptomyces fuscichromogenes]GGN45420.1 hypothetical protein GCM10011578_097320 [Streptomyces fuscichromogenes]